MAGLGKQTFAETGSDRAWDLWQVLDVFSSVECLVMLGEVSLNS